MVKALAHISKDEKLREVIKLVGKIKLQKQNADIYYVLLNSIVSQQLSIKAAETIFKRFISLFKNNYPSAKILMQISDAELRAVGLSFQKISYLKNIAEFQLSKKLNEDLIIKMSDDELIEHLVQIKGVGTWTAEMILMFSMGRKNIFPVNDLGIQNGMIKIYDINKDQITKKDFFTLLKKISKQWEPYKTLACHYIWRYNHFVPNSSKG
ncbi:MAG: DNA-3-methyladenine glycosylase 2 family protein [Bacteroidetes bacterium]|nr:DNA-3-methyladenine glycosylase 2 family protein [Bacteroidota bacterium]